MTLVEADWFGEVVTRPPAFVFGLDADDLHFRARREGAARVHPGARPGVFQAGLWKDDVAEFFLLDPRTGHYLEVNLAPNGGWWSCLFRAPRVPLEENNGPPPGVRTAARRDEQGWEAELSIPLSHLRETVNLGPGSCLHAAFLLDQPQRCLTSAPPVPGEPDFHHRALPQPIHFA